MPIIQLLILPWAADYEIKNIRLTVLDRDHSDYARQLVNKITASGYFILTNNAVDYKQAMGYIERDEADLVLDIPPFFERNLVKEDEASLFLSVNAINGVKANLGAAYLNSIIQDFNGQVRAEWIQYPRFSPETHIEVAGSNWFNPLMNYKYFMVPGILVILLTMVGTNLTTINIVREKEVGTIEQINVTPIRKFHFILGKLIPFWLLGMLILSIGLLIAWLAYGIIPLGSFITIYAFAGLYLLAVLGLGLLISSYARSQQQAMLVSFFIMMIFVLMSGLYTSIDSMPVWAQWVTRFNPVTYFIEVMRLVVLKGSGLAEIGRYMLIMLVFALVLNAWAILSYRKRT
jgi:ABC-2 type transport system permease protein